MTFLRVGILGSRVKSNYVLCRMPMTQIFANSQTDSRRPQYLISGAVTQHQSFPNP